MTLITLLAVSVLGVVFWRQLVGAVLVAVVLLAVLGAVFLSHQVSPPEGSCRDRSQPQGFETSGMDGDL